MDKEHLVRTMRLLDAPARFSEVHVVCRSCGKLHTLNAMDWMEAVADLAVAITCTCGKPVGICRREDNLRFVTGRHGAEVKRSAQLEGSTNSIGMTLVLIPAGEFLMGSPDSDTTASPNEKPQHLVRITKPYYLSATLVTQEQYEVVMRDYYKDKMLKHMYAYPGDKRRPVEFVPWEEAVIFCRQLSRKEGQRYRLPTEAEWEYACRAGSRTTWCFGDDESMLREYAWYGANSRISMNTDTFQASPVTSTHPVAEKKPNAWGLYDMHGNVSEWCSDWYSMYTAMAVDDPNGPPTGSRRVSRGGCCIVNAWACGSARRQDHDAAKRVETVGFRIVRNPSGE